MKTKIITSVFLIVILSLNNYLLSQNTSFSVGAVDGTFNVSPSGAATYQIPIECPPALSNMQPNISLVYNSQAGDGIMGIGWQISGISSITKGSKSIFSDNAVSGFNILSNEKFYLNGNPLLLVSGTYGADGAVYQTENKDFSKIVSKDQNTLSVLFPRKFIVNTKDGRTIEFGASYAPHKTNPTGESIFGPISLPYQWLPLIEKDLQGNFIKYSYSDYDRRSSRIHQHVLSTIEYGGNIVNCIFPTRGQPTYTYKTRIQFVYDTKNTVKKAYMNDYYIQEAKLLKQIIVTNKVNSTDEVVRIYDFTYKLENDKYLLTAVNLKNGNEEKINPTQFTWGIDNKAVQVNNFEIPNYSHYLSEVTDRYFSSADIDGDGISDLVEYYHRNIYNYRYNDKNYSIQSSSDYVKVHKFKTNTSGGIEYDKSLLDRNIGASFNFKDFKSINGSVLYPALFGNQSKTIISPNYGLVNGVKFVEFRDVLSNISFKQQLKYSSELTAYAFGDLNNDGIDEIVSFEKVKSGNYSDAGAIYYIQKTDFSTPYLSANDKLYRDNIPNIVKPKDVFIYDFNGDGLNDIVYTSESETVLLKNMGGTKASDGIVHVSFQRSKTIPIKSDFSTIRIGDFNGDGLPDFLFNEHCNTVWKLALNTGEFDFEYITLSNFTAREENYTGHNDDKEDCIITDFNGDGKSDVILVDVVYDKKDDMWSSPWGKYNRTIITWYQSTGTGMTSVNSRIIYNKEYTFNKYNTTGDFNGDGRDDVFSLKSNLFSVTQSENGYFHYSSNNNFSGKLITKITDGHGNITEVKYQPLTYAKSSDNTVFYEKGKSSVYPIADVQMPLYCVKNVKSPLTNIDFSYKGAKLHFTGKGFLGFESIIKKDNLNGTTSISSITLDHANVMPQKQIEVILIAPGDSIVKTETIFTNTKTGKIYNSVPSIVSQRDYLKGITTKTTYSYDSYNNPTVIKSTVGSNSVTTNTSYYNSTGTIYVLGQSIKKTVTQNRGGAIWIDKDTIVYNTKRLPVTLISFTGTSGNNKTEEKRWTYDIYGNILSQKSAPYNVTTFSGNTFTYDSLGRHLVTETNALNQTITYSSFDKYGNSTKVKDHKGRITSYVFDNWGKPVSVTYPDGTTESRQVAWGGKGLYTLTVKSTGNPESITHYDALGRDIRSGNKRFDGQWQYTDKEYNTKGQVHRISLPFKGTSATQWNNYIYDSYGRTTKVTAASGNVTSWNYAGLSTTETNNGIATKRTIDATGALVSASDPGGTITYTLRPDGQPSSITAPGGIKTLFEYDAFGRQTALVDPSAGRQTTAYSYTTAGVLTLTEINPKGTITSTFDKYGRITSLQRQGEFSTMYVYNADGLLTGETSTNGTSKIYTFDSYDRPVTEKETVPDSKWLQKTITYSGGNISSVQYASQSGSIGTENYVYANGHNTEIKLNGSTTIWKLTAENALGQPIGATTGSITRAYTYNAFGMPEKRTAGSIQNFSYSFDMLKGNLSSRTDNKHTKTESFSYDNQNRLTSTAGKVITYADNGNITRIQGVGMMAYGNSVKPYQVTMLSPEGTAVALRNQSVTYTSFQRPSRIEENGVSASFTYNVEGNRVKMYVANGTTPVLTRYYIGGQYELDAPSNTERLYLGGDAYSAPAVYVKEGGSWKIYYICRDYLGSITHIAYDNGSLKDEYSYDAWGRLRKSDTQVAYTPGSEPALFLGRGYTGHEHLPWFGLVNMNARLYDPALGMFLSPDPYVSNPFSSQNYNRYTYGMNNPLVYIDQTGENPLLLFFATAVFNAAVSGMQADFNGENVGKAIGRSLFVSTASVVLPATIGGVFGHSLGSTGTELLRAGAHGISGGIINAASGGNFFKGFAIGASSSLVGSGMQFAGLDGAYLPFVTGMTGAGTAWAMGEDPLMGFMHGFGVGALNHKGERIVGDDGRIHVLSSDDVIIDGWWNYYRRTRPMQSGALTNVYPEFSLIMLWRGLFNLIPKSAVAAKGSTTAFRSFTSSNFRTNLGRLTGNVPANSQAHHIFPQKYQSFFNRAGVNIHDPKFGAWWEKSGHLKNAAGYNAKWAEFIRLNPNATQSQILNQGRTIIQQYGIPVFF